MKGFSLVELLIVLAIIGVLAAVAQPSYQRFMTEERRAVAQQALMSCAASLEKGKILRGSYLSMVDDDGRLTVCELAIPAGKTKSHYAISVDIDSEGQSYLLIAEAISSSAKSDGYLSLNHLGLGCHYQNKGECNKW